MLIRISKHSFTKIKESGSAMVIALMVMTLLLGFAALVLSRTVTENTITMNDTAESRSFNAAEAALEDATRDFATIVENKLTPTTADITALKAKTVPYFATNGYTFVKEITQVGNSQVVTQTKGQFQGLISLRDEWQIDITAKDTATGVETQVRRRFFNDRIPIFQFGAFYQDDLEVQDPPLFIFNGRIHTNGNFFTNSNGSDIRYKSKITVAGEIIRDRWKSGAALTSGEQSNNVYAPNATNVDTQFPSNRGSVTCTAGNGTYGNGILTDITGRQFPYPNCVTNPAWASFSAAFEGNVVSKAKLLTLPVTRINEPLIEMIRRPKNIGDKANVSGTVTNVTTATEDNGTLSHERYANKEGIRISLADEKDKLPQCSGVSGDCGVRLDDSLSGGGVGYKPEPMTDYTNYPTTTLNGARFQYNSRQVWIKIELVNFDYDNQKPITKDVTKDILSLGVTDPIIDSTVPNLKVKNQDGTDYTTNTDSRSVIKLQRFAIKGNAVPNFSGTSYISSQTINSKPYNFVTRYRNVPITGVATCIVSPLLCTADDAVAAPYDNTIPSGSTPDESVHLKTATFDNWSSRVGIVPFPIKIFDVREGNRANSTTGTVTNKVYVNGGISLVDIDVANLRRFLNGEFDNKFPTDTPFAAANGNVGLKSTDVPINRGWVIYFSDRRGDNNFDGRYNFEDVNPNYDSVVDEDVNSDGTIDKANGNSNEEAPTVDSQGDAGYLAVTDQKFYRRGVRLINGGTLPGNYDSTTPTNTKGFTLASENGVYTWGNYNVSSVTVAGGTNATLSPAYSPQGGNTGGNLHIPASIVGDSVTVLSNNWNDGESFALPYALSSRTASDTQLRFAMLAGDPITGYSPSNGIDGSQNGGLINFKRFLETWTGNRLNYSGSLINLFNSFNSNARHKPNVTVYNPPTRDWTFEESFKDPNRLPPGTPFVYFLTFTGFERVNE